MQIWVDADRCPLVIKEILFRTVERGRVPLHLVAESKLRVQVSKYIRAVQVTRGEGVVDRYIVSHAQADDLVVTTAITLAAEVITKGGYALHPRGMLYARDNISYHLVTHDLLEQSQELSDVTDGPSLLSQAERQAFTSQLDRFLTRFVLN